MDNLYETPADYLEKVESITLETRYNPDFKDTVVKKYMSTRYQWDDRTLSIAVYDYDKNDWQLNVNASSYEEAEETLRLISEKYPEKINSEEILAIWKVYFAAAPGSIHYEGEVAPNYGDRYCETCGDYEENSYEFLYIPACPGTPMDKASILINWSYGCYGWENVAGEFPEKAEEVLSILNTMRNIAPEKNKADIQGAIADLLKVMGGNGP